MDFGQNSSRTKKFVWSAGVSCNCTSQEENDFIRQKLGADGWLGGTDSYVENKWIWATGPEAGTQFWQGLSSGYATAYANWNSSEPNNSGDEDFLEIYCSSSTPGKWNDLPSSYTLGYVVEYGGMSGDPVLPPLYTSTTLNVVANRPPVANNDGAYNVYTGASVSGNLLANDTDADGDDLDVTATPTLSYGSFDSFNLETGAFVYRAPLNWSGTFTFSYTISDGTETSTATVTITITDNIPPVVATKNITVQLDASGSATIVPADINNGSTDNCSIGSMSLDITQFDCSDVKGIPGTPDNVITQTSMNRGGGSKSHWQSWTAPVNGVLNFIQVYHGSPNSTLSTTIYLELYKGEGINGELIANASNNQVVSSATGNQYYTYNFENVEIKSGQKYTWRIYFTTAQTSGWINFSNSNPYSGGYGMYSPGSFTDDFMFKINVTPYLPNTVVLTITDSSNNSATGSQR